MKQAIEWRETQNLMRELWPKWEITGEQLATWKEQFSPLNGEWVREAMRRVYGGYSSESPRLKWVKSAFYEIRRERSATPVTESQLADQCHETNVRQYAHDEVAASESRARMRAVISSWGEDEQRKWGQAACDRWRLCRSNGGLPPADPADWSSLLSSAAIRLRNAR